MVQKKIIKGLGQAQEGLFLVIEGVKEDNELITNMALALDKFEWREVKTSSREEIVKLTAPTQTVEFLVDERGSIPESCIVLYLGYFDTTDVNKDKWQAFLPDFEIEQKNPVYWRPFEYPEKGYVPKKRKEEE